MFDPVLNVRITGYVHVHLFALFHLYFWHETSSKTKDIKNIRHLYALVKWMEDVSVNLSKDVASISGVWIFLNLQNDFFVWKSMRDEILKHHSP